MKVMLIVQRETGGDAAWVVDAADEYTLDEWNGRLPDRMQKILDDDPANTRTLWVEIPDNAFDRLWAVPAVAGTVLDA